MSILGDSASCGAGSNPLAQMNKYMSADRSLQREQQHGQPGGSLRGDMRQLSEHDYQLYQSMQQGGRPDALRFEEFRKNVPLFESNHPANSAVSGAPLKDHNWGAEFAANQQTGSVGSSKSNNWVSDFTRSGSPALNQMPTAVAGPSSLSMGTMNPMSYNPMGMSSFGGSMYGMNSAFPMQQQNTASAPQSQQEAVKPEEAAKWEEEFKRVEKHSSPQQEDVSTADKSETRGDEAKADQVDPLFGVGTEEDTYVDNVTDPEQISNLFGNNYPPNWDEMWDSINDGANAAGKVRAESFRATTGNYEFAKENEYATEDDPFALGVYMMDNGAKLSCAVLCFEEAVKRDPSHVEAWARLGDAQAQNEAEDQAIFALERAVSLNPRHERALLNLAISYTNEGYDAAASQILEKWIAAKYPDIVELVPGEPTPSREQLHERVTKMFLLAAQRTPTSGLDPDVQVGLGVLCYRDDDYEKAIDCFRSALSVRPNDASLWNRLGATLANASHPEEAIDSYYKALELRPSFVRARYNLAVSCINIGCYREAAENILSAITLHDTDDGDVMDFNRSANLIDTLRRVFFAMDRRDLIAKLSPGAKLSDFRSEFKF